MPMSPWRAIAGRRCQLGISLRFLALALGAALTSIVCVAALSFAFSCSLADGCWPPIPFWLPLLWVFAAGIVTGVSGFILIFELTRDRHVTA